MGNHQIIITFFLCLLLSGALESVTSSCAPSSCGTLRNITFPFRLSDEPRKCGKIELSCDGKNAAIYIEGTKYFVKEILEPQEDYFPDDVFVDYAVSVVYAGFSNGDRSFPNAYFGHDQQQQQQLDAGPHANTVVSLMKCSQKIDRAGNKDDHYVPLPSFNSSSSSVATTVYAKITALDGPYSPLEWSYARYLSGVRESCSPLGWFYANSSSSVHSELDVLQAASNTFPVYFAEGSYIDWKKILRSSLKWAAKDYLYDRKSYRSVLLFPLWFLMDVSQLLTCYNETSEICNRTFDVFLRALGCIALVLMVLALKRFLCLPLVFYVLAIHNFRKERRRRRIDNVEKFLRSQQTISPTRYAYSDLIAMTNNFAQKLGQGGFGSVFKGHLQGVIPVAVKVLGASKLNGEEFISEVSTIGRIHHLNVVRLLGFCSEGSKRALIYEYMPNGSPDKHIFATKGADNNNNRHSTLTLEKRNEIALGVARGIHYLHHGCEMQILHFDIKPHNILLDSNLNPKVSDFGLAKLYPRDYNSVSISAARGTIGYMAPELISRSFGVISYKSDVYSFGMLLIEMAGQRRNVDHGVSKSNQIYYPSWIYDKLVQLQVDTTVPDNITPDIDEIEAKLCKVGLWCIQMKPSNRPSMSKVVSMLQENDANALEMPPKPFFSSSEPTSVTHASFPLISSPNLSVISEFDDLP